MTEEPEYAFICESCGKRIMPGEQYQPAGDCDFCEEHAATLADILDFWERDVAENSEFSAWSDQFETIDEARAHVESLRAMIERAGPDHKPLYKAWG